MRGLLILEMALASNEEVGELLSIAPNLRMLTLVDPVDRVFNFNFHKALRVVWLQAHLDL